MNINTPNTLNTIIARFQVSYFDPLSKTQNTFYNYTVLFPSYEELWEDENKDFIQTLNLITEKLNKFRSDNRYEVIHLKLYDVLTCDVIFSSS